MAELNQAYEVLSNPGGSILPLASRLALALLTLPLARALDRLQSFDHALTPVKTRTTRMPVKAHPLVPAAAIPSAVADSRSFSSPAGPTLAAAVAASSSSSNISSRRAAEAGSSSSSSLAAVAAAVPISAGAEPPQRRRGTSAARSRVFSSVSSWSPLLALPIPRDLAYAGVATHTLYPHMLAGATWFRRAVRGERESELIRLFRVRARVHLRRTVRFQLLTYQACLCSLCCFTDEAACGDACFDSLRHVRAFSTSFALDCVEQLRTRPNRRSYAL